MFLEHVCSGELFLLDVAGGGDEDDIYIIKPSSTVPIFAYTISISGIKFSTAASAFPQQACWST